MSTPLSPRVQAALEQISEDESLISDVTDDTAAEVLRWLSEQVKAADGGDEALFVQRVAQLRAAAQTAARQSNDDPAAFVAVANTIAQAGTTRQRVARTYNLVATTSDPIATTTDLAAKIRSRVAANVSDEVAKAGAQLPPPRTGPSRRERRRAKGKR